MKIIRRALLKSALAAPFVLGSKLAPAFAQSDYPSRPIKLVVGFAAGGGNDIFARIVAPKLGELLGQTIVVENRPGAGGRLSAEFVSNQTADGYTLLVGAIGAMSIAAAIYPDLKYHPTRTLAPLGMIGQFPLILVVAEDSPVRTVKELADYAKQNPDKANYPSTSPAFTIPSEELKLATGMPGVMIPYKSSGEMILSVMEGHSMMAIVDPPPAVPQVKAGKVRALAVTGAVRSEELPDVPSMSEAGFPSVDVQLWSGIFVPIATPEAIRAKLEKAVGETMRDPGVSARLKGLSVTPGRITADEFKHIIDADIIKFQKVIKAANLKFEE